MRQRMRNCKYIFYAFSGGRDSQAALELTLPRMLKSGKTVRVLYVDNKSERPGIREHCERICSILGTELTVIEGPTFQEVYRDAKCWPDSIHRDCIDRLINKPMDQWIEREIGKEEDYVLIRGGRPSQMCRRGTGEQGSRLYQTMKSKPRLLIYNPLWKHENFVPQLPIWPGYARGYTRTQCYMCPFASVEDWRNMRRVDPGHWEEMREMVEKYALRYYRGDTYPRRFIQYWQNEIGCPVKLFRYGRIFEAEHVANLKAKKL